MSKINEAEFETAYTDLLAANLLTNTLNALRSNQMIDGVDHDAFDSAMKSMSNSIVIASTSDVFDPRNDKLSVLYAQASSVNYATLIAKLCALFTLPNGSTYQFDLTKLGNFVGTLGTDLSYTSFIKGQLAKIQCVYQDNNLSDNILVGISGMQPLADDNTSSVVFTGLDSAAVTPNGILLTGNQKLVINSIVAVASGATGGNTVYTVDAAIIAL